MNTEKTGKELGILTFIRKHPVLTCYLLIFVVSIILHRLWIKYNLPTDYGINFVILFILPVIGRKSRNVIVQKASEAVIKTWIVFGCILVLDFIINLPIFNKASENKKVKQVTVVTPTVKPSDIIDCKVNIRCGGGMKKLTKTQCDDTICCELSENNWFFAPRRELCSQAQKKYTDEYFQKLEQVK